MSRETLPGLHLALYVPNPAADTRFRCLARKSQVQSMDRFPVHAARVIMGASTQPFEQIGRHILIVMEGIGKHLPKSGTMLVALQQ